MNITPALHVKKTPTIEEQFWARVDIFGDDDCWTLKGVQDSVGYRYVQWRGCQVGAHRVAWELTNGPIPKGLWVLHKCDNPPCCNPTHLFLGTAWDNVHDAMQKGRMWNEEQRRKNGEMHSGKILSKETRRKIGEGNRRAHKGMHHSEEIKRKIGEAGRGRIPWNAGKPMSEETRRKISEANLGNKSAVGNKTWLGKCHTEESKRKNSEAHKGMHHSEETKRKMSAANAGKRRSEEVKRNMREAWVRRRATKLSVVSGTIS